MVERELGIDREQMLEDIRQAMAIPRVVVGDDIFTVGEMAEEWNVSESTVRKRAAKAVEQGLMEPVTTRRMASDNNPITVPAYRFLNGREGDD